MNSGQLIKYDAARQALAVAHRVDEAKEIRDKAIAVAAYARQAKDTEMLKMATEIKIRAEHRAGALMATLDRHAGPGRGQKKPLTNVSTVLDLKALGITERQSSQWQKLATIPAPEFEEHLAKAHMPSTRKILSSLFVKVRRIANQRRAPVTERTCTVVDLGAMTETFGTIYADPPWLYDNQGTRAATSNHYKGLTVKQLCALPIGRLAAKDAHLHLWTTNAFLFECPRIFEAWGFEFRSSFVWVKPQMGIGNYWRNSHEFLLTAIRGQAKSFADKSLISWLKCGRGPHSSKPEQVRSMIERASPGPRLELFARRPAKGWHVWGDQIERDLVSMAAEA